MQSIGAPVAKKACMRELLMSLRAHGSSTVVSCFACASGSCCLAAVGSGWLSLSPLVFAFLDSGAPRFHFLPVVPPGGRFAPCRAHTDSSGRQHTMQAGRAGGTHLSTLIARGLSTTVVRPHGQRARAAQDLCVTISPPCCWQRRACAPGCRSAHQPRRSDFVRTIPWAQLLCPRALLDPS
eukprot:scaffold53948_cov44-Phaeocystis_antarctica.AAC.2